jgi:hypothetical protein
MHALQWIGAREGKMLGELVHELLARDERVGAAAAG